MDPRKHIERLNSIGGEPQPGDYVAAARAFIYNRRLAPDHPDKRLDVVLKPDDDGAAGKGS